jgi:hypothetical protein
MRSDRVESFQWFLSISISIPILFFTNVFFVCLSIIESITLYWVTATQIVIVYEQTPLYSASQIQIKSYLCVRTVLHGRVMYLRNSTILPSIVPAFVSFLICVMKTLLYGCVLLDCQHFVNSTELLTLT